MQKPSIPKGTRDFSPEEMAKRNYIFDTIRSVYNLYGFSQIETPAMENLSTLMGKYGEEGDKLLFKILNSGDYFDQVINFNNEIDNIERSLQDLFDKKQSLNKKNKFEQYIRGIQSLALKNAIINSCKNIYDKFQKSETYEEFWKYFKRYYLDRINYIDDIDSRKLLRKISEKGLRYDLTVPFARYVVMHRNEITFPFKRYQIQPVWRADRPQKGRYREFFQCDADIVGSDSLINEVELIRIMDEVFRRFGFPVAIKMNNRKILSGIAEIIGQADKIVDITVAIDKLDKIGLEKVNEELASKGIDEQAIRQLQPIILLSGTNREKITTLKQVLAASETGLKGVEELEFILNKTDLLSIKAALDLDLTLARGLNYYTGAIFEVKALNVQMGSITGGGRYDNLTGIFGLPGVSGVGISFGADRIFDVLNQLDLYPKDSTQSTQVLFVNFGEKEENFILPAADQFRQAGIRTEIFPEPAKMKKQMSYADAKRIPFVAIVGEDELNLQKVTLKDMGSGQQELLSIEDCVLKIKG